MDNLALQAMVCELRCAIVGQTVQKVKFCEEAPATLCLNLHSDGDLVVCLFPSLPLCFLSHNDLGLESRTSEQSTQLRKLLTGTRIISIKKEFGDRVVFFELENRRFLPTRQRVTLVLELMANRSNILVLEQTQQVLFRLHRPKTPSVSGPDLYAPPVSKSGIQYDGVSREEFERLLLLHHGAGLPGCTSALAKALGLSQTTLDEILIPGPESGMSRWERLQSMIRQFDQGSFCPQVYILKTTPQSAETAGERETGERTIMEGKWVVTPFPFHSLHGFSSRPFATMSAACEHIFLQLREQSRFAALRRAHILPVQQALKKKSRLLKNLRDDQARYQSYSIYKKYADLLYTQEGNFPPGGSSIQTRDLFDANLQEIKIPLDPRLSLIQNANRFSLLFQKANRALPRVLKKVEVLETELTELREFLGQLSAAGTIEQLKNVTNEIHGAIPLSKKTLALPRAARPAERGIATSDSRVLQRKVARHFLSSEGMEILVGKSNRDNDTLTLRIAKADDFWFHVADYSGSHVVLRNPMKLRAPPQQSLLEAAQLAAFFSQARNAPKVEVRYSRKKYVSKPRGSKPGLMKMNEYKSVMVRPGLL